MHVIQSEDFASNQGVVDMVRDLCVEFLVELAVDICMSCQCLAWWTRTALRAASASRVRMDRTLVIEMGSAEKGPEYSGIRRFPNAISGIMLFGVQAIFRHSRMPEFGKFGT